MIIRTIYQRVTTIQQLKPQQFEYKSTKAYPARNQS
jgi:hypothetical protein